MPTPFGWAWRAEAQGGMPTPFGWAWRAEAQVACPPRFGILHLRAGWLAHPVRVGMESGRAGWHAHPVRVGMRIVSTHGHAEQRGHATRPSAQKNAAAWEGRRDQSLKPALHYLRFRPRRTPRPPRPKSAIVAGSGTKLPSMVKASKYPFWPEI